VPASGIYAINRAGKVVTPHRYSDGCYVVSTSKNQVDQVRVRSDEDLIAYLQRGLQLRMSVDGTSASLFTPARIHGWR
jgi:hypothetical protein